MASMRVRMDIMTSLLSKTEMEPAQRAIVEAAINSCTTSAVKFETAAMPRGFLEALYRSGRLTENQYAVLGTALSGVTNTNVNKLDVYNAKVRNPINFGTVLKQLGDSEVNAEWFLLGRWYPVIAHVEFVYKKKDVIETKLIYLRIYLQFGNETLTAGLACWEEVFGILDAPIVDGVEIGREMTVEEVLKEMGLRKPQISAAEFNLKLMNAERMSHSKGKVVDIKGDGVQLTKWGFTSIGTKGVALGTESTPTIGVVDLDAEMSEKSGTEYWQYRDTHEKDPVKMPHVRLFSLEKKNYFYVDVEDLDEHEFDEQAMDRLVLSEEKKSILTRVFNTPPEALFGDLIKGKHGGLVILAHGEPGTGKTLTAEVYAERTRRPLYVLEMAELGTTADFIEKNLQTVFNRVMRWDAVLQFDECEIFLTKRGKDLNRAAIVGIFLRLLDYYRGILFLTTNLPNTLDKAIRSRVMLYLHYENLDQLARRQVWVNMFQQAHIIYPEGELDNLSAVELDGRKIRNLVRLARLIHPDRILNWERMQEIIKFGTMS